MLGYKAVNYLQAQEQMGVAFLSSAFTPLICSDEGLTLETSAKKLCWWPIYIVYSGKKTTSSYLQVQLQVKTWACEFSALVTLPCSLKVLRGDNLLQYSISFKKLPESQTHQLQDGHHHHCSQHSLDYQVRRIPSPQGCKSHHSNPTIS